MLGGTLEKKKFKFAGNLCHGKIHFRTSHGDYINRHLEKEAWRPKHFFLKRLYDTLPALQIVSAAL